MPCAECEKLRKQVRELKEEIAEWERSDADFNPVKVLRWMRKPASPQTVALSVSLANAGGRILTTDELAQSMGAHKTMDPANSVRVHVARARRCLEYKGYGQSIFNQYGVGFFMDRNVGRAILEAGRS